jgi:uncharacterized repeat protein (TIGR02543 family)
MAGVTATDIEDGTLTDKVIVTDPATGAAPRIDTSVVGIYQVHYSVTDSDNNTVGASRAVIVNDGRYVPVPDDSSKPGVITYIIGSKNFVVRQADCFGTTAQARELSYVEVYDASGTNLSLSGQVVLQGGSLPADYAARIPGTYSFTWTLTGHPLVVKTNTGTIVPNEYTVDPGDKSSPYAVIAKDFKVSKTEAATITAEPAYVSHADARVIKLVDRATVKAPSLVDNGGFVPVNGTYKICFGEDRVGSNKLTVTINGIVADNPPVLDFDNPIVIPINKGAGVPAIGRDQIVSAGHVTGMDTDAVVPGTNDTGDITSFVVITDLATNGAPQLAAGAPGVYPVKISVTDADGNTEERYVAVVIDDGNYIIDKGFILRAHNFDIDLTDVSAANPVGQIRDLAEVEAWRYDGVKVPASVISTDGYRDAAGVYHPVVGIYDSGAGAPPTIINSPAISKGITVTVSDNAKRFNVSFDANGGTLVGPRTITVKEPSNTLPYMPASPIRDGYTFRFWSASPSGGSQFTADTRLTGDITLYAQWTAIPVVTPPVVTPPVVTPPPPVNVVVNPPSGGNTTIVTPPPPATEVNVTMPANTVTESRTPAASSPASPPASTATPGNTSTIEPTPTPAAPEPDLAWSLFDLLATILAALLLIVFLIKFFFDRPRDETYEEEPIDIQLWATMSPEQRAQYQARRESDYQVWLSDQQRAATRLKTLFVNAPVLLIVGAGLVEALIVLFASQNFSGTMVIVDNLSVVFAAVVFVQFLTPMVAAVIHNNRRANQRQQFAALMRTPAPGAEPAVEPGIGAGVGGFQI